PVLAAEDGIRAFHVTGVQTCALPILRRTSAMTQQPGITASVHLPGSLVTTLPPTDKNPKELLSPTPSKPEQTSSFDLPGAPQPRSEERRVGRERRRRRAAGRSRRWHR